MQNFAKRFLGDESGATAIEYAVIATTITFGIIVAVQAIGTALNSNLTNVSTNF